MFCGYSAGTSQLSLKFSTSPAACADFLKRTYEKHYVKAGRNFGRYLSLKNKMVYQKNYFDDAQCPAITSMRLT